MTCNMCPDEADRYVQTSSASVCFCRFCSELWWCRFSQIPLLAFYSGAA